MATARVGRKRETENRIGPAVVPRRAQPEFERTEPNEPSGAKDASEPPVACSRDDDRAFTALVAISFGAALANGISAGVYAWRVERTLVAALMAGMAVFSVVGAPLLLFTPPLAALVDRTRVRASWRSVLLVEGEGDASQAAAVAIAAAFSLGAGVFLASRVATVVIARFGPLIAGTVVVLVTTTTLLALLPLAGLMVRAIWPAGRIAPETRLGRILRIEGPWVSLLALAACVPWLMWVVPLEWAPSLLGAAGGGLATGERGARLIARCFGRGGTGRVATTTVVAGLMSVPLFDFGMLSVPVQNAVLRGAPVSAFVLAAGRSTLDRDGDGYSPILLGGDCDDMNAAVHPGARDIPGNGIDEDCSGADSLPFTPVRQPPGRQLYAASDALNIVMLHMDAQRLDHMGFAGYGRKTSPRTDEFKAKYGVWFKNAYTPAASTRLALASLFTGQDIGTVPHLRVVGMDYFLKPEAQTVAERLGRAGYARVGFTNSYTIQHIHNIGQGFERWETPWPTDRWEETFGDAAERTTNAGLQFLTEHPATSRQPYLLFLHYQCTHDPYVKHDQWNFGAGLVDSYDSALAYCDDSVGRILSALETRPDWARTAVILYADHGELFGEHGFSGHGNTLFEPDVHTLLLLRVPTMAAKTVNTPVSLTDLAPTILALAGIPPAIPASDAWNLLPLANDGDGAGELGRPIFLYADVTHGAVQTQSRGVVVGGVKYMRDIGTGAERLYRLTTDPTEQDNRAEREPALLGMLAAFTESWDAYTQSR